MIKASDIGLIKQYTSTLVDAGMVREQFIDELIAGANKLKFDELNTPMEHTPEQLIALMNYKGENIKDHVIPHIFFEVAELLKRQQLELQEYRKDKIYTENDLIQGVSEQSKKWQDGCENYNQQRIESLAEEIKAKQKELDSLDCQKIKNIIGNPYKVVD